MFKFLKKWTAVVRGWFHRESLEEKAERFFRSAANESVEPEPQVWPAKGQLIQHPLQVRDHTHADPEDDVLQKPPIRPSAEINLAVPHPRAPVPMSEPEPQPRGPKRSVTVFYNGNQFGGTPPTKDDKD